MDSIKVFAPASVANIGCGYDTMGFAVASLGEEIELIKRDDSRLVISEITGAELSMDPEQNVTSIAIQALLDELGSTQGFDINIHKQIKPGSGLGSSASSAAGAAFAANELLGRPFSKDELIRFALEGEAFASKSYHADNVAPSLLGGILVIRSYDPLELFRVETSMDLHVLIVFPDVEVKTAESKKLLPKDIPISVARNQWGNVGAFIHALHTNNYDLLNRSIADHIAEPVRKKFIPRYDEVKDVVMNHGSVGFNISGSGPSMFALFKGSDALEESIDDIMALYHDTDYDVSIHRTKIDTQGCRIVK